MVPKLWGELVPGPFAVGFRTTLTTDYSRRYQAGDVSNVLSFRPIFLAFWYPAIRATDAVPLNYGDYLTVSAETEEFASFAARLTDYHREATIRYGLGKEPENLGEDGRRQLEELEREVMFAVRDAPPAEGRFPVVFYHAGLGGTYEDNSVFCEYLASHGYFVVGSAFQPEDAMTLHLDWDLDRSIKDLSFLMNVVANEPLADITRVGAFGQSYGAQAMLAWASERNSPPYAVVSLDSTVDYGSIDEPMWANLKPRVGRAENLIAPLLLFAQRAENSNWNQWDYLTRSARWFAEASLLGHNDFTAQGMIGTVQRAEINRGKEIRRRFDAVCDLTRRFLDSYVAGKEDARLSLLQEAREASATSDTVSTSEPVLTLLYRPPLSESSS